MESVATKQSIAIKRPPVLVVLGHIDHGKTSLLDYIHNTKVASRESGGITQHIGAYQIEHKGNSMTFIDTPGHEAFSAMRARGASVADIALLVVAADDGVMPQTIEALKYIQDSKMPFIVVFNKIDKPEANTQRIKTQLLEHSVAVEGFGGDIPCVEVSATVGTGIDELLEMIMLVAEVAEVSQVATDVLNLVIVESFLDNRRGAGATLIVRSGMLEVGATLVGTSSLVRVRAMEDFQGNRIQSASAGMPVVIFGFGDVPSVGDVLHEASNVKQAQKNIEQERQKFISSVEKYNTTKDKTINVYIKADAYGTLEAVLDVLEQLQHEEVAVQIVHSDVGEITDSDIRHAVHTNSIIIGFRVKINTIAQQFLQNNKATVLFFDTIYDLAEGIRKQVEERATPEQQEQVIGEVRILKVFRSESSRMIVGGVVIQGIVKMGASVVVKRDEQKKGVGKITSLKNQQKDIQQAEQGAEVGIQFSGSTKLEEQDIIEVMS